MAERLNYRYVPPLDPEAEKACRLTPGMAAERNEPPDKFFASAADQVVLPNGYELRFYSTPDVPWRIKDFIAEEQQCCPFFAFETWEADGQHIVRILRVDEEETAGAAPEAGNG